MANHAVKSTEEEKRMYCETGKRQAEEKNMKTYMEFLKDKVIKAQSHIGQEKELPNIYIGLLMLL